MLKVGDRVKWCEPLDADYSYGVILDIKRSSATVAGSGYYTGMVAVVHMSNIEKDKERR